MSTNYMHWSKGPNAAEVARSISIAKRAARGSRWAVSFDACIDCGRTDRSPRAAGRCSACYPRYRYATDPKVKARRQRRYQEHRVEEIKDRRRWRAAHPDYFKQPHLLARGVARHHRIYFGGLRPKVLERDSGKCRDCGGTQKIAVHHIDHDKTRNVMANLVTLCSRCHAKRHRLGTDVRPPRDANVRGGRARWGLTA